MTNGASPPIKFQHGATIETIKIILKPVMAWLLFPIQRYTNPNN
jgi:hypothetical protein